MNSILMGIQKTPLNKSGMKMLIRSLALGLFLTIASAASSFAQYIQIEVSYDPNATDPMPYTMQMKVYADAACTTPSTFSGYVYYKTATFYGCDPTPYYTNHGYTVDQFNASYFLFYGQHTNIRWDDDCGGHIEDIIDSFYSITTIPGYTSYNIATVPVVYL